MSIFYDVIKNLKKWRASFSCIDKVNYEVYVLVRNTSDTLNIIAALANYNIKVVSTTEYETVFMVNNDTAVIAVNV